jgi:hypothetical protein
MVSLQKMLSVHSVWKALGMSGQSAAGSYGVLAKLPVDLFDATGLCSTVLSQTARDALNLRPY